MGERKVELRDEKIEPPRADSSEIKPKSNLQLRKLKPKNSRIDKTTITKAKKLQFSFIAPRKLTKLRNQNAETRTIQNIEEHEN